VRQRVEQGARDLRQRSRSVRERDLIPSGAEATRREGAHPARLPEGLDHGELDLELVEAREIGPLDQLPLDAPAGTLQETPDARLHPAVAQRPGRHRRLATLELSDQSRPLGGRVVGGQRREKTGHVRDLFHQRVRFANAARNRDRSRGGHASTET